VVLGGIDVADHLGQAQDKKMGSGVEQSITGLEQKWTDAGKASDTDLIAPLLAIAGTLGKHCVEFCETLSAQRNDVEAGINEHSEKMI
jgi:hypothetical protein